MDKTRIVLADDQVIFTQSLKTWISNYIDDIEVAGIASNGVEALEMAQTLHPDVIIMDVYMPVMNGVEATKKIKGEFPGIKIIILSTYDEDELVREALLAGAAGYLLKHISPTELIICIRALETGQIQISPDVAQNLIRKKYVEEIGEKSKTDDKPNPTSKFQWYRTLSKREREIFALIATGYDNSKIASLLNLSEKTVRNQISTIYSKLEVKDRFEIIRLANQR
jgi:DNA-binding NarL/FixJ family response regulator